MGYDRFPFDFEPNGIPFGSKLKKKPSPRSYPIQFERKWKFNFVSVRLAFIIRLEGTMRRRSIQSDLIN